MDLLYCALVLVLVLVDMKILKNVLAESEEEDYQKSECFEGAKASWVLREWILGDDVLDVDELEANQKLYFYDNELTKKKAYSAEKPIKRRLTYYATALNLLGFVE